MGRARGIEECLEHIEFPVIRRDPIPRPDRQRPPFSSPLSLATLAMPSVNISPFYLLPLHSAFLRWPRGEVRPTREVGAKGNARRCGWGWYCGMPGHVADSFLGSHE